MKKALKITSYAVLGIAIAIASGILYLRYAFPKLDAAPTLTFSKTPELIKRGEYLANHVTVCIDCHSTRDWSQFSAPPLPGTYGKGGDVFDHSLGFPGTFYAKNITSDKETGIGTWTDGEVYQAFTSGVSKNGDPLFPVMPYQSYSKLTEMDAYAILSYIRSLDPIKNKIPASEPDFPVNLMMRTMPVKREATAPAALHDELSRGKYLLTIAACADCHTPQEKGAPVQEKRLAGGMEFNMPNGTVLRSANITPDKETGIGTWTEDAFVHRFKVHADPAMGTNKVAPAEFNSIMPWKMYAGMEEGDLRAIYKYLMSLEPNQNKVVKFSDALKAKS